MAAPTPIRDSRVKRFSPASLSDSLDATDEFPGACQDIANLVPDITTRNLWTCRPGAVQVMGAPSGLAGVVSVCKVVGNIVYGMCGTLAVPATGADQPFAYNLLTSSFITVTTAGGSSYPGTVLKPVTPPTMDLIGTTLIITHPGYALTSASCKGAINTNSNVYSSGDNTGAITFVGLGAVPSWVVQFNQRAYYGVNPPTGQPSVVASDVLVPYNVTNAGQALTFGNNLPLTCAAPLGLSNQLGGIIQSLMVFQGINNIHQVTGDYSTTTWAVNTLNVATGTRYPRSLCSTPLGLAFMSPAGLRIIDPNGNVGEPIGYAGKGVTYPFTQPLQPSVSTGLCAGCDATTIRISTNEAITTYAGVPLSVEYWYDMVRRVWSGPHGDFNSSQLVTWNGTFICVPGYNLSLVGNKLVGLYQSDVNPSNSSVFTELSAPMFFNLISSMLEDSGQMAQSNLSEMQVVAKAAVPTTFDVVLLDSNSAHINTSSFVSAGAGLYPYRVDFPAQSVFNRVAVSIGGQSGAGISIGDTWMRLQTLAYVISGQTPSS